MKTPNYWLDLFTGTTWQEFLDAGANVSGFRESRWNAVQKLKVGDYLLCYLTGVSRWIGVLEVISAPYRDATPIWKDAAFPCRVKVKVLLQLSPETAVPVHQLRNRLSIFQNLTNPNAWTGHLRGSPTKWKTADGQVVVEALEEATKNPVSRPVDKAKLGRRPKAIKSKIGPVTVPDVEPSESEPPLTGKEVRAHTEIQWLLLKLGSDMGLGVWVARNDRSLGIGNKKFADLAGLKKELPLQFDEVTNRTIENIDVLWLSGNAIVAAFEIESTTSVYSGLLRMSDLISMQPNINIPLYLVAPNERRDKVINEVNRATFSRLSPPLNEICRYLSFSTLREQIPQVASVIRYLKPDVLEEWSEPCDAEEE